MNDGRIVAREFRGYFDGGAYTRLSSYAVIKGTAHLPGPYTIPNVSSNVYGVYTNRTPASAMRGFGITGVDFAIECQMDRVAEAVGMDPVELRLLNAYRDGDMKAHRREAKNCALIECMQVAAEKSGWAISDEFKKLSSLSGGGGERAIIPHTVTDEHGKIGSSRAPGNTVPGSGYQPAAAPSLAAAASTTYTAAPAASPMPASAPAPTPAPVSSQPPATQAPPSRTPVRPGASSAPGGTVNADSATRPATPPPNAPASRPATSARPRNNNRFSSLFGTRRR